MQTFPSADCVWLFCQYLYNKSTFFCIIRTPQGTPILAGFSQTKSRKWFVHNIIYTSAKHANHVHDVTYTECQAQNGSHHSCFCLFVCCNFQTSMFPKLDQNWLKNCDESLNFFYTFFILFQLIWPVMLFHLKLPSDPLNQ